MYNDLDRTEKALFTGIVMGRQLYLHRFAFKLGVQINWLLSYLIRWLCTVDPPYAPLKDRMVSNVTLEEPMTAQQDYRFTATVTWYPPVYPYKKPTRYLVKWSREDDGSLVGFSPSVSEIYYFSHNISFHVMIIIIAHVVSKANYANLLQWNPAITKCHGTEKIVRYSGVFVRAKTPL